MPHSMDAPIHVEVTDDTVRLAMNTEQLQALANTLCWNVDDDTVRYSNDEPGRADFVRSLREAADKALRDADA